MLKAAREGGDVADARRAVADAIAAAAELREKDAALRLDVGRRRADAARRKVAEELSQYEEDEAASSERARDFYEALNKKLIGKEGRYAPIEFQSLPPSPPLAPHSSPLHRCPPPLPQPRAPPTASSPSPRARMGLEVLHRFRSAVLWYIVSSVSALW